MYRPIGEEPFHRFFLLRPIPLCIILDKGVIRPRIFFFRRQHFADHIAVGAVQGEDLAELNLAAMHDVNALHFLGNGPIDIAVLVVCLLGDCFKVHRLLADADSVVFLDLNLDRLVSQARQRSVHIIAAHHNGPLGFLILLIDLDDFRREQLSGCKWERQCNATGFITGLVGLLLEFQSGVRVDNADKIPVEVPANLADRGGGCHLHGHLFADLLRGDVFDLVIIEHPFIAVHMADKIAGGRRSDASRLCPMGRCNGLPLRLERTDARIEIGDLFCDNLLFVQ